MPGHLVVGIHWWKFYTNSSVSYHRARADTQTNGCQANLRHEMKQICSKPELYFFKFSETGNKNKRFPRMLFGCKRKEDECLLSLGSCRNQRQRQSAKPHMLMSGGQEFPAAPAICVSSKSKATRPARHEAIFRDQEVSALAAH